jgi:uncharacterized membrane protein
MDRVTLLSNIPLFECLEEDDVTALAARLTEVCVSAGDVVFAAGDEGDTLFVIQDGAVEITVGAGRTVLAQLFPGQYFGELAVVDRMPRSATATALRDSKLLSLAREELVAFIRRKPDAAMLIMGELSERLRQTNALFTRQVSKNVIEEADEQLSFSQRIADRVASFGGSWTFILSFGFLMSLWMTYNLVVGGPFDPFPFVLLNLCLSTVTAMQAPVIMMSQNRQAAKDKLLSQNDFQVNLKNELGIDALLKGQVELLARVNLLEHVLEKQLEKQLEKRVEKRG